MEYLKTKIRRITIYWSKLIYIFYFLKTIPFISNHMMIYYLWKLGYKRRINYGPKTITTILTLHSITLQKTIIWHLTADNEKCNITATKKSQYLVCNCLLICALLLHSTKFLNIFNTCCLFTSGFHNAYFVICAIQIDKKPPGLRLW